MLWRLPGNDRTVFVPDDIDEGNLAQVEMLARMEEARREDVARRSARDGPSPPLPRILDSAESLPRPMGGPLLDREARWQRVNQERWPDGLPQQPDEPPF